MTYTKAELMECVKSRCEELNQTAADFARECNIKERTMQRLFKGEWLPKDEDVEKICFAIRMNPDLIEKDTKRKPKPSRAVASGIRPEAKAIVKAFQKYMDYKHETDALTTIVFEWAMFKLKEVLGWDAYDKEDEA